MVGSGVPKGSSRVNSVSVRITYSTHRSSRGFSCRARFMGQSVSRGRCVTPCGTGPTFITHLHSFQCRATSTGGHCLHWYSVDAFFDLSDAPITTICSTLGIGEWTAPLLGKNSIKPIRSVTRDRCSRKCLIVISGFQFWEVSLC